MSRIRASEYPVCRAPASSPNALLDTVGFVGAKRLHLSDQEKRNILEKGCFLFSERSRIHVNDFMADKYFSFYAHKTKLYQGGIIRF